MFDVAEFVISLTSYKEPFWGNAPEIAVVGRSNVGKSSFINMLCNRHNLARTSSTPGKTRLINVFKIDNGMFFLIDLPGYGYQAKSKSETKTWAPMIEKYLTGSKNLKLVVLLVDIRHAPSEQDLQMSKYLYFNQIPYITVATKSDKIAKSKQKQYLKVIDSALGVGVDNIIPVSNVDGHNRDTVISRIIS